MRRRELRLRKERLERREERSKPPKRKGSDHLLERASQSLKERREYIISLNQQESQELQSKIKMPRLHPSRRRESRLQSESHSTRLLMPLTPDQTAIKQDKPSKPQDQSPSQSEEAVRRSLLKTS